MGAALTRPLRAYVRLLPACVRATHRRAQAIRRIASNLPFAPQSLSVSPFLDKNLFSYDDKMISASERAKPYADFPIKFYSRAMGALRFKIYPAPVSAPARTAANSHRNRFVTPWKRRARPEGVVLPRAVWERAGAG